MTRRIAVQMDAPETLIVETDTSVDLISEAQQRGDQIWTYEPHHLTYAEGRLTARARKICLRTQSDPFLETGAPETLDLVQDLDVVLMRQDPPFDMNYLTAAHLLEKLEGQTLVVNSPFWVRSSPEKLFPLDFPSLMPPTLVSRDIQAITDFRQKYKSLIFKPLYGNGGAGIFYLKPEDSNFLALLEMFFSQSKEPIMVQAFLPAVREGDKRILLIDGEAIGAINRLPPEGEIRSNLHIGGLAKPVSLDERDQEICQTLRPVLKERGLVLTGIDVIGGWLTEINVTSPTGTQVLKRLSGINSASLFWDAVDRKLMK